MKWITYQANGVQRPGLVVGKYVHGLAGSARLIDLIGGGHDALAEAELRARREPAHVAKVSSVDLRPPVEPGVIRDFLTFRDHLRNCRGGPTVELDPAWDTLPGFYFSNAASVVGPHDDVPIAPGSERFDFELEVGAVIGEPGSNLSVKEAESHIVGYTIFCDWSARDHQSRERPLGLGPAKGKDTANTVGPMLVTSDELSEFVSGPSFHLEMRVSVNGEHVGGGFLDTMDWSFAEMVAYASRGTTLRAGDLLGSGTVPTGCLLEAFATQPADQFRGWLKPGDVVRLEVEQLGAIEQRITEGAPVQEIRPGL